MRAVKNIISASLSLVLLVCALSVTCLANIGYPSISNVVLDEHGILSWNPYEGADSYWLGIDGGFTPIENETDLNDRIRIEGDYKLELEAYRKETDGKSYKIAGTEFYCRYEGERYRIISESEKEINTVSGYVESDTTDYGNGTIQNVFLSERGILTWREYDKAEEYRVGIDGHYVLFKNGESIHNDTRESGEYVIEIDAYTRASTRIISRWIGVFKYDGTKYEMLTNGNYTSVTDVYGLYETSELKGVYAQRNTPLVTALVICAVMLVIAIIVIIITNMAYIKLKRKTSEKA